jgi:hypothetical protein
MRPDRYSRIIPDYIDALKESHNHTAATKACLKNIDMKALDADFKAFWTSRQRRSQALRQ